MTTADKPAKRRAFRGLALVFVLTFVNFVGIGLTLVSLGGLEPWTKLQFLGLFGVIETSAGLSNIIAPNIWHLPVAEMETSKRTPVRLAATTMLIPHWGGGARAAAGSIMLAVSGTSEGWDVASLLLVPFVGALVVLFLGISGGDRASRRCLAADRHHAVRRALAGQRTRAGTPESQRLHAAVRARHPYAAGRRDAGSRNALRSGLPAVSRAARSHPDARDRLNSSNRPALGRTVASGRPLASNSERPKPTPDLLQNQEQDHDEQNDDKCASTDIHTFLQSVICAGPTRAPRRCW